MQHFFLILTLLATAGFMIQLVWFTVTQARNGSVMAVETHLAGKIQYLFCLNVFTCRSVGVCVCVCIAQYIFTYSESQPYCEPSGESQVKRGNPA